ncbi:MAG: AAA family ATPase [Candidatus Infernicultor aquiphilus]|uniref:AAA family ATPase n=1 Tax=Candidatus Infernicultor aquiphilus TaxID=1805029 RepID=A0A2M7PTU7_9BACT|nr:MAG: AAA family ATPase [Candidatus Atribacteria bacterium CG_4_10_14_3_um_filter_34_13]
MKNIEKKELISKIKEISKQVRLPGIRRYMVEEIEEANTKNLSYEEFLYHLLLKEYDLRLENSMKNRIRLANFPYKKYLEDLSIEDLPHDAQKRLKVLTSLDFIESGQNVILAGSPGTGKTHLAIGLGIKACMAGYQVLFATIPLLVNQLKESRSENILRRVEARFEKYDLVIADELGYISFDKEGSELLFTHLSLRAGRKSTIITTNLSFERWDEIFLDSVMTAAMIDRLTHKSYMLNMNGNSYRLKETKEWLAKQN